MWIEVGRCKEDVQKFNIKDLQEGNKYLIRIYARNEIGLSDPLESEEPYEVLHGIGKTLTESFSFGRSNFFSLQVTTRQTSHAHR